MNAPTMVDNTNPTNNGNNVERELKYPVLITYNRNRLIKDYTSPNLYHFSSGIIRPI